MSKFNVDQPIPSVQTEEEYDELLARYKIQSPEKYAIKLASGHFDEYRKMKGWIKPTKTAEKVAEEVAVPKKRSAK
jgi:hypothetical protein